MSSKRMSSIDEDERQVITVELALAENAQPEAQQNPSPSPVPLDPVDENSEAHKERKRRKLQHMIEKAHNYPSFTRLLTADYDLSEDEESVDLFAPQPLVIDIDVAIGLKSATSVKQEGTTPQRMASAADEGWYEGIIRMALPEDAEYLSEVQVWTRHNLEFFSATNLQRRLSTSKGRVGIRCIHCARAREGNKGFGGAWPSGAVSFPNNVSALYSTCTQKPQLHFESCPFLPEQERAVLSSVQSVDGKRRRRSEGGLAAPLYYAICCKRIGLVDTEDGMRFGRDLKLDPLPFETIRFQVDSEQASNKEIDDPGVEAMPLVAQSRLSADEESERILAEAVLAPDQTGDLSRSDDKNLVSDYFFLTIRQTALCHAMPLDFSSKGKKTRLMRVGFTGFCCRHCMRQDGMSSLSDFSCRSFSSAADNLSSSISNSFSNHLQKCSKVPQRIKKALAVYRRLHQRQLAQLPYGSQRRLIHELWARLRAADLTDEQVKEKLDSLSKEQQRVVPAAAGPETESRVRTRGIDSAEAPDERPASMPVCDDPETQRILKDAEDSWDNESDNTLMLPSERWLVSDFVFLILRNLQIAYPDTADASRSRRSSPSMAGLCCRHCVDQEQHLVSPSGRSFPSAPDNFASALNSSLYSHMQVCSFVPPGIQRALAQLRKIHSLQCSSHKFGSQRRFFNLLYDRLKQVSTPDPMEPVPPMTVSSSSSKGMKRQAYKEFDFLLCGGESSPTYLCRQCRMVPIHFRAPGSWTSRVDEMRNHRNSCQGLSVDLSVCVATLDEAVRFEFDNDTGIIETDAFESLVKACAGGDERLAAVLVSQVRKLLAKKRNNNNNNNATIHVDDRENFSTAQQGLWSSFPSLVDSGNVLAAFEELVELSDGSKSLDDHPRLQTFLLLLAPTLNLSLSSSSSSSTIATSRTNAEDPEMGNTTTNNNTL